VSVVWDTANGVAHMITVQKFSATTYPKDVKDRAGMSRAMRRQLDRRNIGTVWRARVGRATRWSYAFNAETALARALYAAGIETDNPDPT